MSRTKAPSSRGILDLLSEGGHVTADGRKSVESFASMWSISPFEAVLETHLMSEAALADALAASLRVDRLHHLTGLSIAEESLDAMPFHRAREQECLVLREDEGVLDIVVSDPTKCELIDELKAKLPRKARVAVAERGVVIRAIDEMYPMSSMLPSLLGQ